MQTATPQETEGAEPQSEEGSHRAATPKPDLAASPATNELYDNKSTKALDGHTEHPTDSLGHPGDSAQGTTAGEGNLQGEGIVRDLPKKRRASMSTLDEEEGAQRKIPKLSAAEDVKEALKSLLERHGGNTEDLMKALEQMKGQGLSIPSPLS